MDETTNAIATDSKSTYIIRFNEKIYKFEFSADCTYQNILECFEYMKTQVEIAMNKNSVNAVSENTQSTEQKDEEGKSLDEICEEIDQEM